MTCIFIRDKLVNMEVECSMLYRFSSQSFSNLHQLTENKHNIFILKGLNMHCSLGAWAWRECRLAKDLSSAVGSATRSLSKVSWTQGWTWQRKIRTLFPLVVCMPNMFAMFSSLPIATVPMPHKAWTHSTHTIGTPAFDCKASKSASSWSSSWKFGHEVCMVGV